MGISIGIINLQYVNNYGCVFGAYALQQTIKSLGVGNVELIDNCISKKSTLIAKLRKAVMFCQIYGLVETCRIYKRPGRHGNYIDIEKNGGEKRRERFEHFRDQYLSRSTACQWTCEDAPFYNIYIAGSDVVWLLQDLCVRPSPGFLEFTEGLECRRIAYAASLGDMPYKFGERRLAKS